MIEGIDVSYYQGQIDWPKVAAAGKKFAIIRSGDGTFLDPMFETYLEGAKAAGLYVDIYHYLRFGLTPEQMAGICNIRHLMATHYNPKARLWLDWEDTSNAAKAMPVTDRVDWALKLIGSLSCPIGHYSAAWWWNPYMGNCDPGGPKWVAHYKTGGSPTLPSGWGSWSIWQYGSSGAVDGIEGVVSPDLLAFNVDLDLAQDGFFREGGDSGHHSGWGQGDHSSVHRGRGGNSGCDRQGGERMKPPIETYYLAISRAILPAEEMA